MPIHPLLHEIFTAANLPPPTTLTHELAHTAQGPFIAKTARGPAVAQLQAEAASLRAMALTAPRGLVPRVIGLREADGHGAFVCDYLPGAARGAEFQRKLGAALAAMHAPAAGEEGYTGKYGFGRATFCGATEQDNTWEESWEVFFRDRRLGDLVRRLGDGRVDEAWEEMRKRAIPLLLHAFTPAPTPVILHGDLWSGNVSSTATGEPGIFDPASYYGHAEADLGITHMFGGFSPAFYKAYHDIHPRSEPYYHERQRLYELYHHLNHALMFGGGYTSSALRIMRSLVDWADGVPDHGK